MLEHSRPSVPTYTSVVSIIALQILLISLRLGEQRVSKDGS
jgi:hypothetical protein